MIDLSQNPIIYVTRDIERALGLSLDTQGYHIISNTTDFAICVQRNYPDKVFLIEEKEQFDTWELLKHKKTAQFIENILGQITPSTPPLWEKQKSLLVDSKGGVGLVVFKPTKQIEELCKQNNWNLLNPFSSIANKAEEKISQIEWLGDLKKYLPDYQAKLCKDIEWNGKQFVLQFNRSHTGSGTALIDNEHILNEIKQKFPNREARIAPYIKGPLFTNNNVVTPTKTLLGNISYQITGLEPFTDRPFATIGNDWGIVKKLLSPRQIEEYKQIATDVGNKFQEQGWKGLFGIDVVVDEKTGILYLLEINARQAASTTYESQLQRSRIKDQGSMSTDHGSPITTFEAHLAALLDIDLSHSELITIDDGAQIIQRVTNDIRHINPETSLNLKKEGFNTIVYNNTDQGSDLLRIQSKKSIMESDVHLNQIGLSILQYLNRIRI